MNDKMTARVLDWRNRQTETSAGKKALKRSRRIVVCVCALVFFCVCMLMMNAILIHSVTNARKNYFITNFGELRNKSNGLFLFLHSSSQRKHIHASDIFVIWFSFIFAYVFLFHFLWHFYCTHLHRLENRHRISLPLFRRPLFFCRLSNFL